MFQVSLLSTSENKDQFLDRFYRLGNNESYSRAIIELFNEIDKELIIIHDGKTDLARSSINVSYDKEISFLGMLYCSEENEQLLNIIIKTAKTWSMSKNCLKVIGPIDLNIWLSNRVKSNAFDDRHYWEPSYSYFYLDVLRKNGFTKDRDYFSCFFDSLIPCFDRTKPAYDMVIEQGYKFEDIDLSDEKIVRTLYGLNIEGFDESYLYSPLSFEQYIQTYLKHLKVLDLTYSCFITSADGEKLGYIYSIPDGEYMLIKSFVLKPQVRGARLSSALVHYTVKKAIESGKFKKTGGAMVRRGNTSENFFNHIGKPEKIHEYILLKLELV